MCRIVNVSVPAAISSTLTDFILYLGKISCRYSSFSMSSSVLLGNLHYSFRHSVSLLLVSWRLHAPWSSSPFWGYSRHEPIISTSPHGSSCLLVSFHFHNTRFRINSTPTPCVGFGQVFQPAFPPQSIQPSKPANTTEAVDS